VSVVAEFIGGRISVRVGDLTRETVDAIVNAANRSLLGGGGVDGAIHAAGGPQILKECRRLRETILPHGLNTGDCVSTSAGRLPARRVIHTVGPIYGQHAGEESELLASCYERSLALAANERHSSIAFPAISTGVYGFPKHEAAQVSSGAIARFLRSDLSIEDVRLVFFSARDAEIFIANANFDYND
jgi:O-acetyl-ADP-ribose deacetylase (regulator of RNase III)